VRTVEIAQTIEWSVTTISTVRTVGITLSFENIASNNIIKLFQSTNQLYIILIENIILEL
jgi:hypothetical protein